MRGGRAYSNLATGHCHEGGEAYSSSSEPVGDFIGMVVNAVHIFEEKISET
jgi:hypothetical protein